MEIIVTTHQLRRHHYPEIAEPIEQTTRSALMQLVALVRAENVNLSPAMRDAVECAQSRLDEMLA